MQIAFTRRTAVLIAGSLLIGIGALMMIVGLLPGGPSYADLEKAQNAAYGMELFFKALLSASGARAIVGGLLFASGFLCLIWGALLEIRDVARSASVKP